MIGSCNHQIGGLSEATGLGYCFTCDSYRFPLGHPRADGELLAAAMEAVKLDKAAEQGQKVDTGKPAIDLIDPFFVEDVAGVLTFGAVKYDLNQWQRGMAIGKAMAGVLRHCFAILRGEYTDPESGKPHAAHAACGLMFVHYFIRNGMLNVPDDRFKK